jgi:signal peptidase I
MEEPEEEGLSLGRVVVLALLSIAVVWPVRAFVGEPISVASGSMEPTLPVGRHLFVDKLTLRLRAPRRGEVILLKKPVGDQEEMLKRVIALPGDVVEIKEKFVVLNGRLLDEPFTVHRRPNERLDGDNLGPLTVPPGHVFVLGDNRDESDDSAVWRREGERIPFLPLSRVLGLARGVY